MNPSAPRQAEPASADDGFGFGFDDAGPDAWRTGTAIDEFTPLYMALARPTNRHGSISPADADALDLSVVAALLGVGGGDGYDFDVAAQDLARQRAQAAAEGRPFTW